MPIAIGQKLGRYRVEEELGAGGMGVVYRAYDDKLERDLAIKVLAAGTLDDPAARKRFRNEALILSRLNHPSIQTIHDFDTIEGHDLLVSELVQGMSLDVRLHSGALPEKDIVRLGVQLAQGLTAAHAAGILHRDLKPANLRVTPDGRLKILDFGLATLSRDEVLTISRTTDSLPEAPSGVSGTLPYMPPEQLLGETFDERSDIYSAGVALFEMATGRMPFAHSLVHKLTNAILHESPPQPRSLTPKLSEELERIILKCMEKDPELRYQSAKELAADLKRMEAAWTRSGKAVHLPVARQRPPWMVPALALLGIGIVASAGWWRLKVHLNESAVPQLRWEQLTNFNDAAQIPAVSPDGKIVAFVRGRGDIGMSADEGQIWFKTLPEGDPIQLTRTQYRKQTLSVSPDGTRLFFTQIQERFGWNTFEVPLLGGQEPKLFMANATGLSWIGRDRLLFSTITHNVHMVLMTSNASRTDARTVYQPQNDKLGMVHRSALSPDGKWVLLAEMNGEWFESCILAPFDGSSAGKHVGPNGTCTWAQWSPDGKWMYFTVDTGGSGFHVWRQRFPDGTPQQLTASGASEEEGLAMMPDGKSFITSAGTQQSSIWLHDDKGDRQLTSEGFASLPTMSSDGKKLYYMRRVAGARSYYSGELWVSDISTGEARRLFPGLLLTHFSLSRDGGKVLFATEPAANSGIWIADLDGTQPPRQLTRGSEYRAFFGPPGQIFFEGTGPQPRLMRMNEDGSGQSAVSDLSIMQLQSVSPDGRWAVVGVTPPGNHGDRNTMALAVPTDGGKPITLSENASVGYGAARLGGAPLLSWSRDEKSMYIALRYLGYGSKKSVMVAVAPGAPPPGWINSIKADSDVAKIPGARLLDEDNVYPAQLGGRYVIARKSARTNLFRIYLQ